MSLVVSWICGERSDEYKQEARGGNRLAKRQALICLPMFQPLFQG